MEAGRSPKTKPRRYSATVAFFPLAGLYGLLFLPLSIQGMLDPKPWLQPLDTPLVHAHELFFGYALAVVTGFLVSRAPAWQIALLASLWLMARLAVVAVGGTPWPALANAAFALALALIVAPKFMKGAKKWRNKLFGPLVLALAALPLAWHGLVWLDLASLRWIVAHEAVLVFTLLMLFMGGRVIAPAAAGAMQKTGRVLEARVQPTIEGSLLLGMIAAIAMQVLIGPGRLSAMLLALVAGLAIIRILRWQPWHWRGRQDLLAILAGYAWLPIGLLLLATSQALGLLPAGVSIHAITVGALGTLTTTIMARVWLLREKRDPAEHRLIPVIALCMGVATLLRLLSTSHTTGLWSAAFAWSLGLILLLALFTDARLRPGVRPG